MRRRRGEWDERKRVEARPGVLKVFLEECAVVSPTPLILPFFLHLAIPYMRNGLKARTDSRMTEISIKILIEWV